MTIKDFKDETIKYLNRAIDVTESNIELNKLNNLIRVIELIEEDVVVKAETGNYFVEGIPLYGILNCFNEGEHIIKLSEV